MDVRSIIHRYGGCADRLMDILHAVQAGKGFISDDDVSLISQGCGLSPIDVRQTASFYHFFADAPRGACTIYLNTSVTAEFAGRDQIARAFETETGCRFGEVTACGRIGLFETPCIGLNDQEPAALINGIPFTHLTPDKVQKLVAALRNGTEPAALVSEPGDGANASPAIASMVCNNIRCRGDVVFADYEVGSAVHAALAHNPEEIISILKYSNMRGRGGAGFPTGLKWEFCRKSGGAAKYVICNADEGEPGTFKDRVILTERLEMTLDGMIVAGYAIGASAGIIYLRAEYAYLARHIDATLADYRTRGLLGDNAGGRQGFTFDIRLQLGAGAYVCGEESALIESAEGKRGEPRYRPPFPVEKGYRGAPTSVNNVETFCCAARIMLQGAEWFRTLGTDQSSGTKVLSVSGDCARPGIYEVPWGTSARKILDLAGADPADTQAIQVGGPSGCCISPADFERTICFADLATGGSFIVIGKQRDLLAVVKNFMDFFCDESCGSCTPCRAGNVILRDILVRIMDRQATMADLDRIRELAGIMRLSNRCGLGQSSFNPLETTIRNFPHLYHDRLVAHSPIRRDFDLTRAVSESCACTGRTPQLTKEHA